MTIIMQITAPHAQKRCCFIAVTPSQCFGMSDYCSRKGGCLSLSKRTRSCGFRHFSVLAGSHAILPLERCVELAHTLIPYSLCNLLNGHPGGADQLLCPSEALLNQKAVNRHAIGAAEPFFQEGRGKRKLFAEERNGKLIRQMRLDVCLDFQQTVGYWAA